MAAGFNFNPDGSIQEPGDWSLRRSIERFQGIFRNANDIHFVSLDPDDREWVAAEFHAFKDREGKF